MISDSSQKEPEPHIACQLALPAGDAEIDSTYDVELERRTLRKFDFFVLPQFMIMVLISYLDRSNIGMVYQRDGSFFTKVRRTRAKIHAGNARVFGFEEGLNLTGHQ